jgi:hypothetical protein
VGEGEGEGDEGGTTALPPPEKDANVMTPADKPCCCSAAAAEDDDACCRRLPPPSALSFFFMCVEGASERVVKWKKVHKETGPIGGIGGHLNNPASSRMPSCDQPEVQPRWRRRRRRRRRNGARHAQKVPYLKFLFYNYNQYIVFFYNT